MKLIYTFEAGGLLTGSPKGEGGLRSAGAVEGGAVGLATAAAAAARARCVSNDAGVLPWTRSGPRQEWESDRASKRASERESKRQENTRDKRQKQPMGKVNVVVVVVVGVVGSEFHKSLQEAAAAGQKFVDFVAQCIQIRICPMIQPNLDFNFK